MDRETNDTGLFRDARKIREKGFGPVIHASGLVAVSNFCRNGCTYCGLRGPRRETPRRRLDERGLEIAVESVLRAGLDRVLFISGEDPELDIPSVARAVRQSKKRGLHVSLALGELPRPKASELKDAGADCYCLKFETSDPGLYERIKPGHTLETRLRCIDTMAEVGFDIATGNIIGLAGQSEESLKKDFALTLSYDPFWIPLVPYVPAPNTPMGDAAGPGDVGRTLETIARYRKALPKVHLTAGQPDPDKPKSFADLKGNGAALDAGADIFFIECTPEGLAGEFDVIGDRALPRIETLKRLCAERGLELEVTSRS